MAKVRTGRLAAKKYFTKKEKPSYGQSLFALSVGTLAQSKNPGWLEDDFKAWSLEAFYQNHGGSYVAFGYHLELQKFITEKEFDKIGFLLSFSVPRPMSFPVYMGVAAGPGFFVKSGNKNSNWTLDYRAYLGLRFSGAHIQYFLQTGLRNHLRISMKDPLTGLFITLGLGYRF